MPPQWLAPGGSLESRLSTVNFPPIAGSIYPLGRGFPAAWEHLIYAYMVENTRIYDIFERVLREFAFGERLAIPGPGTQQWTRATEDLFYRDTPPFRVWSVTSYVRPDLRASRRNAYYRMFGMDLVHGLDDGRPYPYPRPEAANRQFVAVFEEWLREVWVGIENANNQVGPNRTDDATIANLANQLYDMLTVRRQSGNMSREEFFFVATMAVDAPDRGVRLADRCRPTRTGN